MARGIDLSSLTRAERIVILSGLAGFANGFIPWWYRALLPDGATVTYGAGLTVWSVIAVGCSAVAAIAVLARASIWPNPAPTRDGVVYTLLGAFPVVALVLHMASIDHDWIGVYVGIVCAAVLTYGGLRRRSERAQGWT